MGWFVVLWLGGPSTTQGTKGINDWLHEAKSFEWEEIMIGYIKGYPKELLLPVSQAIIADHIALVLYR